MLKIHGYPKARSKSIPKVTKNDLKLRLNHKASIKKLR
jgi:hypothetical protein